MSTYEQPTVNIAFPYYNLHVKNGTETIGVTISSSGDGFPGGIGFLGPQEFLEAIKAGILAAAQPGTTVEVDKVEKVSTQIIAP